jgi:3-hydroxybutyryl-CoA dehydrogenase
VTPDVSAATTLSTGIPASATVAIIGAGAMGAGIAQIAALAGHRVLLFDNRMQAADNAKAQLGETFSRLAARGKLTADAAAAASARIMPVHALGDCVNATLVIEAIVEDLDTKRRLLGELDVVVADDAILASNTSSLSITALATGTRLPGRVVGMHFFNPAPVLPLVEVVSGLGTSPAVAQTIFATARAWGKTPVHARSTPGFIVNRCARPFYGEALRLLAERAAEPATLDAVMREAGGFRMGPCELMDLVGHDVNFAVTSSLYQATFHDPRFRPSVIQQEMVAGGLLGRKSGRGFYAYADGVAAPVPATEALRKAPARVTVYGDLGSAAALVERMQAGGVEVNVAVEPAPAALGAEGALCVRDLAAAGGKAGAGPDGPAAAASEADDAWLVAGDGRTATLRAAAAGVGNLVVFDLARDYATCTRLAVASADSCSEIACDAAVAALQAAGLAVSRIADVGGLVVLRTVAMLANEAADAVNEGIATAEAVDLAMRMGVNYPAGPLEWADAIGVERVCDALGHLAAYYGDGRYRLSPLIARRAASATSLRTPVGVQ